MYLIRYLSSSLVCLYCYKDWPSKYSFKRIDLTLRLWQAGYWGGKKVCQIEAGAKTKTSPPRQTKGNFFSYFKKKSKISFKCKRKYLVQTFVSYHLSVVRSQILQDIPTVEVWTWNLCEEASKEVLWKPLPHSFIGKANRRDFHPLPLLHFSAQLLMEPHNQREERLWERRDWKWREELREMGKKSNWCKKVRHRSQAAAK